MPNTKELESIVIESSTPYNVYPQKSSFDLDNKGATPDKIKETYHDQRIKQSKWAFRVSLWGSIIGFASIIWGIGRSVEIGNPEWVGLLSGTILEAVSALFYSLSNKANEKISEFFQELTKDANVKSAISLSNQIENSKIRDGLKTKLALHLVGIDEERICKNTNEICCTEKNDE